MTPGGLERLGEGRAVSVLALLLDHDRCLPDPVRLRELDAGLAEAVATGGVDLPAADLAAGGVGGPVWAGGLARDTLAYLVGVRPETAAVVERAVTMTEPGVVGSRFDPATLAVGALVVLALQTDICLDRASAGKWKLSLQKKALTDAALVKLLAKLIATYTSPG